VYPHRRASNWLRWRAYPRRRASNWPHRRVAIYFRRRNGLFLLRFVCLFVFFFLFFHIFGLGWLCFTYLGWVGIYIEFFFFLRSPSPGDVIMIDQSLSPGDVIMKDQSPSPEDKLDCLQLEAPESVSESLESVSALESLQLATPES
jgi:hypothetical protein